MAGDRKNEKKKERSKKWRNIFNKLMNKESQEQVNNHNLTNKRLTEWNKKKEIQNKANECNKIDSDDRIAFYRTFRCRFWT